VAAAMACGGHHGQAMGLSARSRSAASRTPRFVLRLKPRVLSWIIRIGLIGPLLQAFLT